MVFSESLDAGSVKYNAEGRGTRPLKKKRDYPTFEAKRGGLVTNVKSISWEISSDSISTASMVLSGSPRSTIIATGSVGRIEPFFFGSRSFGVQASSTTFHNSPQPSEIIVIRYRKLIRIRFGEI